MARKFALTGGQGRKNYNLFLDAVWLWRRDMALHFPRETCLDRGVRDWIVDELLRTVVGRR